MSVRIDLATIDDQEVVLDFIQAYHAFEEIPFERDTVRRAIEPLLAQTDAGRIWLVYAGQQLAGYIALCFGYSIEFGGRDAFLDEMYLDKAFRGQGIGKAALSQVAQQAAAVGIKGIHLEVNRDNLQAQKLYTALSFEKRDKYFLMTRTL